MTFSIQAHLHELLVRSTYLSNDLACFFYLKAWDRDRYVITCFGVTKCTVHTTVSLGTHKTRAGTLHGTRINERAHTHTLTHTHTHKHTHIHTYTHTLAHTHIYTRTHTSTHVQAHTHHTFRSPFMNEGMAGFPPPGPFYSGTTWPPPIPPPHMPNMPY